MKNNNFIPFFILVIILTLSSCEQRGTIVLNNLQNDTTIVVPIKWITSDPSNVILNINGYADDTCKIGDFIFLPKGKINMTINNDWYDNEKFVFFYKKYKSKHTSLKIDYYFPGF
jgi:hypothetical protein